jgi:hypothetical protein
MAVAYLIRALVQGDMSHDGARQAPKGFNGSWDIRYDSKTGAPMRLFTVEERAVDAEGKTKVTGYYNCVAKGELKEAIEAAQWTEVELVADLRFNRDTKYLQLEVVKVSPVK